jgi:hypothetical protein
MLLEVYVVKVTSPFEVFEIEAALVNCSVATAGIPGCVPGRFPFPSVVRFIGARSVPTELKRRGPYLFKRDC